ncbi:MAG: type II toxin-antitoxin system VapC family toxin [Acidobacteriota bacterium]
MNLKSALREHQRIALDTNVFIYHLDANPRYVELAETIFAWIEESGHSAVTSTLTMTEILVGPYRAGDVKRARIFRAWLSDFPHLDWTPPDLEISNDGARLRAEHRLAVVDALQAATAIRSGATCLIGNDATFKRVPGIEILLLDDFVT